jgi:hypothetical protein
MSRHLFAVVLDVVAIVLVKPEASGISENLI